MVITDIHETQQKRKPIPIREHIPITEPILIRELACRS